MFYTNGIGYAIAASVHDGFHYSFFPASPFHTQQVRAGAVGNIIIKILPIRKYVVVISIASYCIRSRCIKVLHQHQFKIFMKRFDHGLFIHLAEDIMYFKFIFVKLKIEELKAGFTGKNHSYTAVWHGFNEE